MVYNSFSILFHVFGIFRKKYKIFIFILFSPRHKRFKNPFSLTPISCFPFLLTLIDPTRPYLLMLDIGKSSCRLDFYRIFSIRVFVVSIIICRHHHFVKLCRHVGVRVLSSDRMFFFVAVSLFFFFFAWNLWPMPSLLASLGFCCQFFVGPT